MPAGLVQVPPDSTGKKLDTSELTVGANTVERQNVTLSDPSTAAALAAVVGGVPAAGSYGLATRNLPTNTTASGTLGALNATVALAADGLAAVAYEVDAGLVGTVVFEGTTDNTNWFALNGVHIDGSQTASETTFAARGHILPVAWAQVRLRVSAYTSGSSAGRLIGSQATASVNTELSAPQVWVVGGLTQPAAPVVNAVIGGMLSGIIYPAQAISAGADGSVSGIGVLTATYLYQYNGANWDRMRVPNVYKVVAAVAITAGTGATVWTPTSGKKFRLMGFALSSTVASAIKFLDQATEIFRSPILAAAGVLQPTQLGNGILSTTANNLLKLDATVTTNVTGTIWGIEE